MKKKFIFISVIAAFGLGSFLVSCDKDDDNDKCICDGENFSLSEVKDYGFSGCADFRDYYECD